MALNRRSFLKMGGGAALGTGLGMGCYAGEFERHHVQVNEVPIALPRLGDALHGLRIVQMSDFHYDEFTEPYYIRDCVQQVNAMKPDVVLLTGDFISYAPLPKKFGASHSYPCAALLSELTCTTRYAVMGNHDAEVGIVPVTDALETHGIPVLENKYVPLERDGKRLWIAGTGDVLLRLAELERAVPPDTVRGSDPVLLMVHEPDFVNHVAQYGGVDLMLSGHTHGGQIRVPFMKPIVLPPLGEQYVEGLFRVGATQLYVNRGIGTVGVPFRFNCRPEITVFTLSGEA